MAASPCINVEGLWKTTVPSIVNSITYPHTSPDAASTYEHANGLVNAVFNISQSGCTVEGTSTWSWAKMPDDTANHMSKHVEVAGKINDVEPLVGFALPTGARFKSSEYGPKGAIFKDWLFEAQKDGNMVGGMHAEFTPTGVGASLRMISQSGVLTKAIGPEDAAATLATVL